ncbi:MAG: cysteine--tRNA ligase [bacterium]|nr:cysteine--tRNA ligase [bacterium]
MSVQLYNTLTRKKEPLETIEAGKVRIYVCGVTVYDHCHLGHARATIVFDVIRRYLESRGFDVTYVVNFTDVDDKIIARAKRLQVTIDALTAQFIDEYYADMDALGVRRADIMPRATEHIPQMVEMIEKLIDRGIAYAAGGDVYYDISKFPAYGKLSNRNPEDLEAGTRIEPGEGKHNPLDFTLWKGAKPGEPEWESPWGAGRPGWHLECSVMSSEYLGERFDIHGGGNDLVFPHHENEIAQSEGCYGHDWVRYWMHNGLVQINHEKMSKSKGNYFTIKAVLQEHPAEVIRFFLLGTHYRHPVDYSDQVMADARKGIDRLYNTRLKLAATKPGDGPALRGQLEEAAAEFEARFAEAMDDDFNTALALGHLFDFSRRVNGILQEAGDAIPEAAARPAVQVFEKIREVFGLFGHTPEAWFRQPVAAVVSSEEANGGGLSDPEVEKLLAERAAARTRKDFAAADQVRDTLTAAGIILEDGASGTIWKRRG